MANFSSVTKVKDTTDTIKPRYTVEVSRVRMGEYTLRISTGWIMDKETAIYRIKGRARLNSFIKKYTFLNDEKLQDMAQTKKSGALLSELIAEIA